MMQLSCARRPAPLTPAFQLALPGIVAGAAAGIAGLLLGQLSTPTSTPRGRPCSACNGDGYIDCFCARWTYASSSDARRPRCDQCRGSLRMRCPKCRGGGTGVPTLIRVPIPALVKQPLEDWLNRAVGVIALFAAAGKNVGGRGLRLKNAPVLGVVKGGEEQRLRQQRIRFGALAT